MSARVNGVEIPDSAILAEMQYHPAADRAAAQRSAAQALVVRELLRQAAAARGLGEDEDAIDRLLEEEVDPPDADEETCRRWFEANRRRFRAPDLAEAQHILIAAPPDDEEARIAARARAASLLDEIRRAPERFGELARAHSACPSKDSGGHLGQVTRGSTVPEFETYLFALDPGELCTAPVPSRWGFHVVRCLAREIGRELPWEHARPAVERTLRETSWRQAVRHYLSVLAGRAAIDGVAIEAATSPLLR